MKDTVQEFTSKLEMEFQDLQPGTLKPESEFRKIFDWSSINALIMMAFVETEYRVNIQIFELETCNDIQSLYDLVNGKAPRRS